MGSEVRCFAYGFWICGGDGAHRWGVTPSGSALCPPLSKKQNEMHQKRGQTRISFCKSDIEVAGGGFLRLTPNDARIKPSVELL